MTVVQHKLTDAANAAMAHERVPIRLVSNGFVAGDQREIINTVMLTTDATGAYSVDLTPQSQIDPTGTHYEVTHPGGETLSFTVPDGAGPFWLRDILVQNPASPSSVLVGVQTVNGKTADASRNVQLAASDVGALALTGGTMTGDVTSKDGSVLLSTTAANGSYAPLVAPVVTADITGAYTVNLADGGLAELTVTGNVTLSLVTPTGTRPVTVAVSLIQDATGGHTVTLPGVKWPSATPPLPATTAGSESILTFCWTPVRGWRGFVSGLGMG